MLRSFYQNIDKEDYSEDYGDGDYRDLLRNFSKVARVFNQLDEKYRQVILNATKLMGDGMAEYIEKTDHASEADQVS